MNIIQVLTAASTCFECLNGDSWLTNFWCTTSSQCLPKSQINECQNHEHHDMVLNATVCCSSQVDEKTCLSPESVSYCLWCPDHEYNDVKVTGMCMYSDDFQNVNKNCRTNPDITSFCSELKTCATCAADVVCAWCPTMGRCVTSILQDMQFPLPEYKCLQGQTKVCCDSYNDCQTCSQYSNTISAQICTWCQMAIDGTGKCMTHDKAVEEPTCKAINELGRGYCEDACYMKGRTCGSCIGTSGCIWLEKIQFINTATLPPLTQYCAVGGAKGPASTTIEYETTMTMPYTFNVISYNYMTCSMNAATLNTLVITLIVTLVVGAIAAYISVVVYKKVKYNRLLREAAKREVTEEDKKLLQQKQEEFDIQDYMITIQAIPWTD